MNKAVIIGLGGLALVVVAGVIIFAKPFQSSSQPQGQISTETSSQGKKDSDVGSIKGTIKDLFARNIPMECTFTQANEEMKTIGTVYLSGGKIRSNFQTIQDNEQSIDGFMIQDGEYIYTWTSEQSRGMKIKLEDQRDLVEENAENLESEPKSLDFEEQDIDYTCKPWLPDNSFFTPPSDIEFTNLNQQIEQIEKTTEEMGEISCDVCDQLPEGEGQIQCRQSLGCE